MFMDVWLGYYRLRSNLLETAGTNDWSDILHVTYLESDPNRVFVTDDKKIGNLLSGLFPGAWLSVNDFIRHSNSQL